MVLLPVKQYYPQTDSATGHGDRMCFSSTCAMAIKYLVPGALLGSNADDDYLRTVLKYGDTTQYTSHLKACQQYGVFASFYQKGTRQTLVNELKAGYPVATGILHKGHVSAPRGGGHWMLLIGDDGTNGVFHDPYGEMDNVNGGYVTIGRGGKDVKYSWKNWLPRWEVEGRGTGWFMTFRPMQQQQPITPVENTFKGVKAAAAKAGAKYPECVAAQWALESGYGKHTSGKNNYFGRMIEAAIPAVLAVITGFAALTNRLHRRIDETNIKVLEVDRRIDTAELTMARHYVYKEDFEKAFRKMEDHMVRIENKLDQIVLRNG